MCTIFLDGGWNCWNRLVLDASWKWPLRCCDCVGESGSLSANPSESHLCFSLTHLWPFSSSLGPNPLPVRSWGGEGGGVGERERAFSSGCFLWFWVFVNVSKPQGLAGLFRQTLEGKHIICFWLTTKREKAILNQTNSYQRGCQILWETQSQRALTSF